MRTTYLKLGLSTLAVVSLAACGDAGANEAAQADLKRDLELASATTMKLVTPAVDSALLSAMETKPMRAPENATVVKRGAGNRAVRSATPTVEAEPESDAAAVDETEVAQTLAEAPAPDVSEPVAVAPRPQPTIIQTGGAGDYGTGSGGMGGGMGGMGGGMGGVVLRGGGVDGDNCDLHRRGRTGNRGPIYIPQTTVPVATGTRGGGGSSIGVRSPGGSGARAATSRPAAGRPSRGGMR